MTARAVVFDLDGTLLDTMSSVPQAYVQTIRQLGGPDLTPRELVAAWHLGPSPVILAHFLGRAATPGDLEHFYGRMEAATESARPFPGIPELLQALNESGHSLAVYTSATSRVAGIMLARTGLSGYFPVVLAGDQVTSPKPAPDGLLDTCRLLGVPAAATAYVGDAETDLRCALAAGAIAVHARWSPHAAEAPGHPLAADRPGDVMPLLDGISRGAAG